MTIGAARLNSITSAVFYELNQLKNIVKNEGKTIIDLGIGSPDLPPPPHMQDALRSALTETAVYGYPRTEGTSEFRETVASFLHKRYQAKVKPDGEVLTLMGSQDGLAHLPLALTDPGDIVLIPDPGYPIYEVAVRLAGAIPYAMPLLEQNGYLPDLHGIPADIRRKAKFMILNYPSNPVTATTTTSFFSEVVEFAKTNDMIVVHDAAYIELVFADTPAPSFLAVPGAKEVGIELHSLSKTFNFAGARIAFAAGKKEVLAALSVVKSNIDYGVFTAIQKAGAAALDNDRGHIARARSIYQDRRDAFLGPLQKGGWDIPTPSATMFVWMKIPTKEDSRSFAARILRETGVVSVPGMGFGCSGEGYIRIALVQPSEVLEEAAQKIIATL